MDILPIRESVLKELVGVGTPRLSVLSLVLPLRAIERVNRPFPSPCLQITTMELPASVVLRKALDPIPILVREHKRRKSVWIDDIQTCQNSGPPMYLDMRSLVPSPDIAMFQDPLYETISSSKKVILALTLASLKKHHFPNHGVMGCPQGCALIHSEVPTPRTPEKGFTDSLLKNLDPLLDGQASV